MARSLLSLLVMRVADSTTYTRARTLLLAAIIMTSGAGCGSSSESNPDPMPSETPTATVTPRPTTTPSLFSEGERLFFQETFDGNGRTCGTCHPSETGFTLTPEFIAQLPADDPLFVAETNPALTGLENPQLLRGPRALILENFNGFDAPPVFRGVPHIFDQPATAPYGWSGNVFLLEEFIVQAVRQHLPKTLARIPGADFREPTTEEIAALTAFMNAQTLQRPGFDPLALVGTPAQTRGREAFQARGCASCHSGPVLTDNAKFDTGVTQRAINLVSPPECPTCTPIGQLELSSAFDVPALLGLANSAPYFHDNSALTLRDAVAHYNSPEFNGSSGATFSGPIQMTDAEIDDITEFLNALIGPGVTDPPS